jgi:hypothetical protein
LVIWDRLFGTQTTGPRPPDAFGLDPGQALRVSVLDLQLLRARQTGAIGA